MKKVSTVYPTGVDTYFGSTRTGDLDAIGRVCVIVLRRRIPGMKAPRLFFLLDEDGSSSLLPSVVLASGKDTKLQVWVSVVDVTLEGTESM